LDARRFVLLVDDDPAMSDMYGLGLERHGFRVVVLQDPTRLNETVEADPPDVLVLDWDMPQLRGDEALERLRQIDAGRQLPVFMLSNFPGTNNGAIDRAFAAGALAWLEKVNTTPARLATKLIEAIGPAAEEKP
jgi:two-component system phosphate regulon response regulator PhoB